MVALLVSCSSLDSYASVTYIAFRAVLWFHGVARSCRGDVLVPSRPVHSKIDITAYTSVIRNVAISAGSDQTKCSRASTKTYAAASQLSLRNRGWISAYQDRLNHLLVVTLTSRGTHHEYPPWLDPGQAGFGVHVVNWPISPTGSAMHLLDKKRALWRANMSKGLLWLSDLAGLDEHADP